MAHRACAEFHAAAEAGRGLPAIERGMPAPAGTGMSRRSLLLRGAGLGLSVYTAGRLGGIERFEEGIAAAAEGGPQRVIVNVFLEGGIDGLSVLAPVADPRYRELRPKLALPESDAAFAEDPRLVWHPSAASLAALHGEGKLCVMPAVGYTDADQSHFTSRHYWEVGATDPREVTGWLGRWLDRVGAPDNPVQGLSLDGALSPTLASGGVPVAAVTGGADYDLFAPGVWGDVETKMRAAVGRIGRRHLGAQDIGLRQAAAAAANAAKLGEQLAPFRVDDAHPATSPVPYPKAGDGEFPTQLATLARLIAGGLPVRAVALRGAGSYDTHEGQAEDLATGLRLVADTLLAFQRDLEARGVADRVLTLVWSEFGRRVEENGSLGTDHGAAGIGFVLGSRATGRMAGEFPGLDQLDDGNLRATLDFRGVYCALLEQWLGFDAAAVIPGAGAFARPALIR